MSATGSVSRSERSAHETVITAAPRVDDGVAMWQIAAASRVLDVNTRYAYALWCRDFAASSIVARLEGRVVGFVTGYRRPDDPRTLFVWQVAVHDEARGKRVAATMLDDLVARVGVPFLETTITADNGPSIALFTGLAERRSADVTRTELFDRAVLGADHDPEILFRIGPMMDSAQG